jgi:serine phosphatase RsbU (regulator of sigma subunit)/anti-sigma regulatory factor (Ser/Thr protein kinase)
MQLPHLRLPPRAPREAPSNGGRPEGQLNGEAPVNGGRGVEDPYAGADMPTVRRAVAVLLAVHTVLAPAFLLLLPSASDLRGWTSAVMACIVAGSALSAVWVASDRPLVTFNRLLAMSFLGILATFALVVVTGHLVPFAILFLVWIGCAAVQPRRGGLGLVALIAAATVAPSLAGAVTGEMSEAVGWAVLFAALGVVLTRYVSQVRRQRIELRSEERDARALAEAANRRVRDLQRVTDATLVHLPVDHMLRELLDRILKCLDLMHGAVLLGDPAAGTLRYAVSQGLGAQAGTGVGDGTVAGLAQRAASARGAVVVNELEPSAPLEERLVAAGVASAAAAPLRVGGDLLGILCVGAVDHEAFDEDDAAFLQLVADRVALAVDRTRMFESQRDIAETLQRSLLAGRLPRIPGARPAVRYFPGGAGLRVGGDWYDVLDLGRGRIGLAIGDVVGRGVRAASLMGKLRTAMQAYALEGHDPAAILERLHGLLEKEPGGPIATVLYLVLDPDAATVEFSNAGHLAPLVREGERGARFLSVAQAPPLGAASFARFELQSAQLDPEATIVLFTDGLVERRGVGLTERLERLRALVEAGPEDPEALCDAALAEMQGREELEDDVALLVVGLEPLPEDGMTLDFPAEPEVLAALRTLVERWLQRIGASPTDIYAIKAATMEACANSIEHAYRPGDAAFRVELGRADDDVTVTVRDFGRWREQRGTDRGRGLLLMDALMDSTEVTRTSQGSTVELRRHIEKVPIP